MKPIKVITTPDNNQYIELYSREPLVVGKSSYAGFLAFRLVRKDRTLYWLVDELLPPGMIPAEFTQQATVQAFRMANIDHLDTTGHLEFRVHLTSPVFPRTHGVFVCVAVEYDTHDGLRLTNDSYTECWTGSGWGKFAHKVPNWLMDDPAPWVIEEGDHQKSLSAGNRLLCADWNAGGPACGNLVHIDPLRTGGQQDDFRASLVPVALDAAFPQNWTIVADLMIGPDFAAPAPLNDYALGLSDRVRGGSLLGASGMHLRCTPQVQDGVVSGWSLRWSEVPGQSADHAGYVFTLESFSEAHLAAHAYGLASARSRNRLSIVPTWISTFDANAVCHFDFDLKRDNFDVSDISLNEVLIDGTVELVVTCGGAVGLDGVTPWQFRVLASVAKKPKDADRPPFLNWSFKPVEKCDYRHKIAAGSVVVSLDAFDRGSLSLTGSGEFRHSCSEQGGPYRRAPLETSLELVFTQAHYAPLSMDPEIGFETLSAFVGRPRPWTFDLGTGNACPATLTETANRQQSRLLRITLNAPQSDTITTDVLLVDPCPLTIVRVHSEESVAGREIVAEYIDDSDQAPEWRFFTTQGQMTAVLPPQGIGEEMVKGYLFRSDNTPVPVPGALFDFRLTPVAKLLLDRTDIDMARAEPPWSLRRMLGQRQGVTGLKLDRARFELLYGLQAEVETPGLRIAELDGLVGRVPYSEDLGRALMGNSTDDATLKKDYASKVSYWQADLWNRPSWWRVFRDISQRQTLKVDRGVQYALRKTRQTADPFTLDNFADDEGKASAAKGQQPLRGGVDWPFQSRNIYRALLDAPESTAGSVEGLVFGTLGGEGSQTAAFDNGKTLIVSSSRQGRLDSLTLIRVGRISMLWNKARHVIVYERTTRRAPRYDVLQGQTPTQDDLEVQPELSGFAAMRKVREYIEISEPKRRYPDSVTERPVAGPLVQSVFATTVVPVMSSWGHDVPNGFVMALRGPIPSGKEQFFPEPHTFLDFARPSDKGGGAVSQRVVSIDRLVFFSSTRGEDGGDTDRWPPWPGIDFPLIRPPAVPKLPSRSSFAGVRQPDAQPVELGMRPYTLDLAPAEEAVNLMHGRNVAGLDAKVSNINLARGLPDSLPLDASAQEAQKWAQNFGDKRAVLLDSLMNLRAGVRQLAAADSTARIADNAQLQQDLKGLMTLMSANVDDSNTSVLAMNLDALQTARNQTYQTNVTQDLQQARTELQNLANRAAQATTQEAEAVRHEAMALADAINARVKEHLGNVGVVRIEALESGRTFLADLQSRLASQLTSLASRAVQAVDVLQAQSSSQPQRVQIFENDWRDAVSRMTLDLRGVLDTLRPFMNGALGMWYSPLPSENAPPDAATLRSSVLGAIEPVIAELADYLDRWLAALPAFDVQPPRYDALRAELTALFDPQIARAVLDTLNKRFVDLIDKLGVWDATLQTMRQGLDALNGTLQAALPTAALPGIPAMLATYASDLNKQANAATGTIIKGIADSVSDIAGEMDTLQGSFDALKDYNAKISDSLKAIEKAFDGTVGDLQNVVADQVEAAESRIDAASRQMEEWARAQIGAAVAIGKENVNAALETVRMLAEGPVTEGLQVTRDQVGYYFDKALDAVSLTPVSAIFNDLGQQTLNALSTSVPVNKIFDRLLPDIAGMAVRDLFPDFCGIKLTDLLPDLDVPVDGTSQYDWLTIQHGFNKERLSAWARVSIDKRFDDNATLFDLGPVKLRLLKPLFHAVADMAEADGRWRQSTEGRLEAAFELSLNDQPMVTLVDGILAFDERGHLDFQFDSNKLELAPELQFVQQALQELMPDLDGLVLTPQLPAGIQADLTLPLPDIGTGAFTLTGITLTSSLALLIGDGFEIRTGFWLSKPERPFGLAVLFLGGGGWFGVEASFKPPTKFVTRVSIGISAGAFVAVNFGFAAGSAGILFTVGVDFFRDWQTGSGKTAITIGILIWGEFSILGIASAGVRLTLSVTYSDDGMVGNGVLSASIRICWCFTLRVNRSVQKQFTGGSSRQSNTQRALAQRFNMRARPDPAWSAQSTYASLAPPPDFDGAVAGYFQTLAI